MRVGGKNASKWRREMANTLRRYYAGDPSLIQEIQSNLMSDAPLAKLARESLAYDQVNKMVSMPSAVPSVEQPVEQELPFNKDADKEEEEVPFENKTSGKKRMERQDTQKNDEDLELDREERRLSIAERKQALRREDQALHREDQLDRLTIAERKQALLQDALEHLKTVSEDGSFDDDIRAAIKQRTLKIALDGR